MGGVDKPQGWRKAPTSGRKRCREVEEEGWSWPRHQGRQGVLKAEKGEHMPDGKQWAVRAMVWSGAGSDSWLGNRAL